MKKKVTAIILSAAILTSGAFLFAACSKDDTAATAAASAAVAADATAAAATVNTNATTVNAAEEMTPDRAIDIAVAAAGVARDKAVFEETPQLDNDNATPHYDVEFTADGVEYDYEIGLDGTVLKAEKEKDEDAPATTKAAADSTAANPTTANTGYISVDDAKAAALAHAGLSASEVTFEKAKFDSDEYIAHYDIEFVKGNTEYDYEINAKTGAVMDYEKDYDTAERTSQVDTSSFIGATKAKEIALSKAGLSASEVTGLKCELDADDLIAHYSVEFKSGKYEYDYEINAKTGKVMGSEKEIDR